MSYILDALKKLEKEKGIRRRSDGVINITGELLSAAPQPEPVRLIGKKSVTALVVVLLVIGGGVYWYVASKGKARGGFAVRRAPVERQAAMVPVPVPPVMAVPAAPPQPPPTPVPQVPLPLPVQPAPVPVTSAAAGKGAEARAATAGKSGGDAIKPPRPAAPAPLPARPALMPAPADIKVQGIAWQEERQGRRAVVNGFLMQEGGTVLSAKIREIRPDRVRFSSAAGDFEIALISSPDPAAGKGATP